MLKTLALLLVILGLVFVVKEVKSQNKALVFLFNKSNTQATTLNLRLKDIEQRIHGGGVVHPSKVSEI